jgi:hypothetical protein
MALSELKADTEVTHTEVKIIATKLQTAALRNIGTGLIGKHPLLRLSCNVATQAMYV